MIKLLIVDDESTTRKGLKEHIQWNELGVNLVEEARDGIDALEISGLIHPNIVLSDIKMPGMNGIEFAMQLREQVPDCKIIFFSGYSDKEYLISAIKLRAIDYIEKPINLSEVKEVVKKAVDMCNEEEKEKSKEENIHTIFSGSLPFMKQKIIKNLITKNISLEENLKEINLANIPFSVKDWFTVIIIKLHMKKEQVSERNQADITILLDIVDKCFSDIKYISTCDDSNQIIVILSSNTFDNQNLIIKIFDSTEYAISESKTIDINLFCAVGQTVHGMEQIPKSYHTAFLTLGKLFFYGYNNCIFYKENTKNPFSFEKSICIKFIQYISDKKQKRAVELIDWLCREIHIHDSTPVNDIKNIFFTLTFQLLMEAEKKGIYFGDAGQNNEKYLWSLISDFETLQELRDYLVDKITIIFRKIDELESECRAVFEVKKLIEENYNNYNLSTRILAEQVFLTPTYLSALFKKETGETISEYIIDIRIEKSKKYLVNRKLKVLEVANNVGYNDANYYAKVFKKVVGMNPSEYREKYIS